MRLFPVLNRCRSHFWPVLKLGTKVVYTTHGSLLSAQLKDTQPHATMTFLVSEKSSKACMYVLCTPNELGGSKNEANIQREEELRRSKSSLAMKMIDNKRAVGGALVRLIRISDLEVCQDAREQGCRSVKFRTDFPDPLTQSSDRGRS